MSKETLSRWYRKCRETCPIGLRSYLKVIIALWLAETTILETHSKDFNLLVTEY